MNLCQYAALWASSLLGLMVAVQSGSVYNTVSVMGREYDPNQGNNTVTVVTDVQPGGTWAADLSVANAVDHATANPGDSVIYTVTVANDPTSTECATPLDAFPGSTLFK